VTEESKELTKEPDIYTQTFQDAVAKSFGPIIDDFGFSSTRLKEWMFELKSQNCLVVIFLERQQVFMLC